MSSETGLRFSGDVNKLNDPTSIEWSDDKDEKLQRYLKEKRLWPAMPPGYSAEISWEELARRVNSPFIPFVQLKVDELYQQHILDTCFKDDDDMSTLIRKWNDGEQDPLFEKVENIINGLGLQEYERDDEKDYDPHVSERGYEKEYDVSGFSEFKEPSPARKPNESTSARDVTPTRKPNESTSAQKPNESTSAQDTNYSKSSQWIYKDVPRLTKTQRRMSLDLMHLSPDYLNQGAAARPGLHKRNSSLGKPATASTSNVNVITKADVTFDKPNKTANGKNDTRNVPIKNRLKDVSKRFKFNLGKKSDTNDKVNTGRPALAIQSRVSQNIDKTPPFGQDHNNESTQKEYEPRPRLSDAKSSAEKATRRVSMVGESLPLYIRQQLEPIQDHNKEAQHEDIARLAKALTQDKQSKRASTSEGRSGKVPANDDALPEFINHTKSNNGHRDSTPKSSVSRKASRIHNLLANSQSLYLRSKDAPGHDETVSQNGTNRTDDVSFDEADNDLTSENDKEYISPTSVTKYYGVGYDASDDDDIGNGLEDIGDVDFINVTPTYDVDERPHDSDEDEYLFSV